MKMRALVTLAIVLAVCACGEDDEPVEPALDIELVPDPNVNSPLQIIERVGEIWLQVDGSEGLYAPGEERVGANYQIKNLDSDPTDLELLIKTGPVGGPDPARARLPVVRLERGGLDPNVWLRITALGFLKPGTPRVAVGEVKGASFGKGIQPLTLPFNLLPEYLPPRVTALEPAIDGCSVGFLALTFSKPIKESTLVGAVTVGPNRVAADVTLDPRTYKSAQVVVPFGAISGGPDAVTIQVQVASTVTDQDDIPLDDVPAQPGAQPYSYEDTVECAHTSDNLPYCGEPTALQTKKCPAGFTCGPDDVCVPSPDACAVIQCAAGYVCDAGFCEVDCRLYGDEAPVCAAPKICDRTNGVCR